MRKLLALTTIVALPLVAGCAVHQDTNPGAPSGPAEASVSFRMSATPDSLFQDGTQSASISITAFDATGNQVPKNVRLAVTPFNFGTLSASTVTTPVIVKYTPPAANTGGATTVTIQAALIGVDSSAASTQQVSLFVSPSSAISNTAPTAAFAISPSSVSTGRPVVFDGSSSCGGPIVSGACSSTSVVTNFSWNFGDNTPVVSGQTVVHTFAAVGNYKTTLTVTNDQGRQAAVSYLIAVNTILAPTSSFVVSPTTIHKNVDTVNFNGTGSLVAAGHTIVRYDWNFGDGASATTTTPNAAHIYTTANTFKTTLTVTDDVGQSATSEQDVIVLP